MRPFFRLTSICVVAAVAATAAAVAASVPLRQLVTANHGEAMPLDLDAPAERSLVYDRNGNVIAVLHAEENRSSVALADIPAPVVQTILAIEDEGFYRHKGVDLRATLRALFANVESGEIEQGGSTITMQLVKNLSRRPEQTLERKTREAVLAWRLEQELSKDEILERYLNTVYFGNGAYGVQAAAEVYFGKSVGALGWAEAALLAALIRNPRDYDPFVSAPLAIERRRIVLQRLVETAHLTRDEADFFSFTPLPTAKFELTPPPKDYFVEAVKQRLLDDPAFGLGDDYTTRYNAVFKGGLRIHTTIDPVMQEKAIGARNDIVPGDGTGTFSLRYKGEDHMGTVAMVSVEPGTGAVRDLVGGPGFEQYKYDLATQGQRQPGSAMKTFVLVAALENGLVPTDTVDGGACSFPNPGGTPNPYNVRGSGGVASMTDQTARSVNCAFLRLGQIVGIDKVVEQTERMGVTSELSPVLSLPLGTSPISPLEMAGAYASIANDGMFNEPYFIDRVEDGSGRVLFQHRARPQRVMSEQSARLATQSLQAVITRGTATSARLAGGRPAAGKTGTAEDYADAWFVGFTPQLSTAVWMGVPAQRVPMQGVGGINVFGGSYPARIWRTFMDAALGDEPVVQFTTPDKTRYGKYQEVPRGRELRRAVVAPSGGGGGASPPTTAAGGSTTAPTGTAPPTSAPPTSGPPPSSVPPP